MGQHVGLVDPGKALDRRTASHFSEGTLESGATATDFRNPRTEPHADEPHIALFNRPQHELGLLVHAAQSAAHDVTTVTA